MLSRIFFTVLSTNSNFVTQNRQKVYAFLGYNFCRTLQDDSDRTMSKYLADKIKPVELILLLTLLHTQYYRGIIFRKFIKYTFQTLILGVTFLFPLEIFNIKIVPIDMP